jgi:cysteine synthase A
MARKVALTEGLLVGMSSGAAIKGAIDVAIKLGSGKKVVTIAPDNGERYLSTALFPNEE